MRYLSLFSGIGAMDYGMTRAGWTCVGQCEIEPYCRAVLEKHWPDVFRWSDVCDLPTELVRYVCGPVDAIVGGFACQDVSTAGQGAGIGRHTRSGLTWRNLFRLIRGLRPAWILIENVPALRNRGADRVLRVLERIGYALQTIVVGAEHVGAPHRRHRVWIVGTLDNADSAGRGEAERRRRIDDCEGAVAVLRAEAPEPSEVADADSECGIGGESVEVGNANRGTAIDGASDSIGEGGAPSDVADTAMCGHKNTTATTPQERPAPQSQPSRQLPDGLGRRGTGDGGELADTECGEGVIGYQPDMQRRRTGDAEQAGVGGGEEYPAWIPCPCCDEYFCTIHGCHTFECDCPEIDEWSTDPYSAGGRELADTNGIREQQRGGSEPDFRGRTDNGGEKELADTARDGQRKQPAHKRTDGQRAGEGGNAILADAKSLNGRERQRQRIVPAAETGKQSGTERLGPPDGELADTNGAGCTERHPAAVAGDSQQRIAVCGAPEAGIRWPARPGQSQRHWEAPRLLELGLGGSTDGTPAGMVRDALGDDAPADEGKAARLYQKLIRANNRHALKGLGNAVVWVIPFLIASWMNEQNEGGVA